MKDGADNRCLEMQKDTVEVGCYCMLWSKHTNGENHVVFTFSNILSEVKTKDVKKH